MPLAPKPGETTPEDWNWLKPLLDATLEADQPLWVEPKKHMRGSGVGAECVRAMTLDMLGHRVPFSAHTLRIFRVGNLIEQVNVEVMKKAGILAETQGLAEYVEPPIIGHFDMSVYRRPGDGKLDPIPCRLEFCLSEANDDKAELFQEMAVAPLVPLLSPGKVMPIVAVGLKSEVVGGRNVGVDLLPSKLFFGNHGGKLAQDELDHELRQAANKGIAVDVADALGKLESGVVLRVLSDFGACLGGAGMVSQGFAQTSALAAPSLSGPGGMREAAHILANTRLEHRILPTFTCGCIDPLTDDGVVIVPFSQALPEGGIAASLLHAPAKLRAAFGGIHTHLHLSFDFIITGQFKCQLGECKSIKSALFAKLPSEHGPTLAGESPLMKTHASYVKQWTAYAGRESGGPMFDEGFILFEEKDQHRQKVFYLLFDIGLYDEMLAHVAEATAYVAEDPPRAAPIPVDRHPFSDSDRTCASCPKKYLCKTIPVEGATLDEVRLIDAKLRG